MHINIWKVSARIHKKLLQRCPVGSETGRRPRNFSVQPSVIVRHFYHNLFFFKNPIFLMWLLFGIITVLRVWSTHSPCFHEISSVLIYPWKLGFLQFLITCSSSRLVPCLLPLPSDNLFSALQPEWCLWNVHLTSHCLLGSSKAFLPQDKMESPAGGHRRCRTWAHLSDLIPSVLLSSTSGSLRFFKHPKHAPSSGPLHLNPEWTLLPYSMFFA